MSDELIRLIPLDPDPTVFPLDAAKDVVWRYYPGSVDGLTHKFYVAGGFHRDIYHGIPPKDVDVFVVDMDSPRPPDSADVGVTYELSGRPNTHMCRDYAINLVPLTYYMDLETLLKRMDIGLCQIGADLFDPANVRATRAFYKDATNFTLTVTRTSRWGHIERVMQKFPGHTLIDPFGDHTGHRSLS